MLTSFIKRRALDLFRNNIEPRIEALHAEQIFQGLFDQQCRRLGHPNDYYPVGAAAGYSLMYLTTRMLTELPIHRIVEMGSGQTTLLIDRIRSGNSTHVAFEDNATWAQLLEPRLTRCDYRLRALTAKQFDGVDFRGYSDLNVEPFDFLLVDGPNGTDSHSRYDCLSLIDANPESEFIVVIDDASRKGERETVAAIQRLLTGKRFDFKLNHLQRRTTQAVFTTPRFRAASYFY